MAEWLEQYRKEHGEPGVIKASREADGETDDRALLSDVAFNRHSMNDGHHVGPSDNGTVQIGTDGIRVALVQGIDEDLFRKTLSAATRATIGLDMSKALPGDWEHCDEFKDWVVARQEDGRDFQAYVAAREPWSCGHDRHEYSIKANGGRIFNGQAPMADWEEMLKGGLQTALESQVIVFAVGGVSRTCTHQLVRSRRAAFHQQSQRASYMGDAPEVRMPESVWRNPRAREAFFQAALASHNAYRIACEEDISYQDARFALLEGTTNFIMLEYPVREFLNVYAYRGCSMFQWEIVQTMRECRRVLVEAHPWIEPYVKISCEKTGPVIIKEIGVRPDGAEDSINETTLPHHCTFQGWEDVEGQCDFAWARHEARTFKPEHHRITRKDK